MSTSSTKPCSLGGGITIGRDLTVRRLGFGAMRITGDGIWGPPVDRASAVKPTRHVVESDVNVIDTADSYGGAPARGKIRLIGVSEMSVEEYERCKRSATIVSVQNLFNVRDRCAADVLHACKRDGIAFLLWFPLGGKGALKHGALGKIPKQTSVPFRCILQL